MTVTPLRKITIICLIPVILKRKERFSTWFLASWRFVALNSSDNFNLYSGGLKKIEPAWWGGGMTQAKLLMSPPARHECNELKECLVLLSILCNPRLLSNLPLHDPRHSFFYKDYSMSDSICFTYVCRLGWSLRAPRCWSCGKVIFASDLAQSLMNMLDSSFVRKL